MKRTSLIIGMFAVMLILGSADAGEWIETDTYVAPMATISIDGNPGDWAGIEPLTAIEFRTAADEWVVFEEYDG